MILIEGPDQVGKTTLALECQRILAKRGYAHTYQHQTKPPLNFDPYWHFLPYVHPNVVQDRLYLSWQVYSTIFGHQRPMPNEEVRLLEAAITQAAGYVVVVTSKYDAFFGKQWAKKDRVEMYECDDIVQVNREYRALIEGGTVRVDRHIVVDMPDGDGMMQWPSSLADAVVEDYLGRRAKYAKALQRRPIL